MRTISLLFVLLISFIQPLSAQKVGAAVEYSGKHTEGTAGFQRMFTAYVTYHPDSASKFGAFFWNLLQKGYGESLVGLLYAPMNGVQVSAGYGFEQNSNSGRYTASLFAARGRFYVLAIGEDGGSGPWYNVQALAKVHPNVSVGGISRKFLGTGPRLDLHRGPWTLWVASTWDDGARRQFVALKWRM